MAHRRVTLQAYREAADLIVFISAHGVSPRPASEETVGRGHGRNYRSNVCWTAQALAGRGHRSGAQAGQRRPGSFLTDRERKSFTSV
jgi:hypothetical protein